MIQNKYKTRRNFITSSITKLLSLNWISSNFFGCKNGNIGNKVERELFPKTVWDGMGIPDLDAFPLGPQSGDPLNDGLILWCFTSGSEKINCYVSSWTGSNWEVPIIYSGESDNNGFVHIDINNIGPDQPVAYQFVTNNGNFSPVGYSRSAPNFNQEGKVRFGATSCLSFLQGSPFKVLSKIVEYSEMDFFVFLGDTVYADGSQNLEDYNSVWYNNFNTKGFRDVQLSQPCLYTWDDHEIDNNWDPELINQNIYENGLRSFLSNTPLRKNKFSSKQIWRSFRFGKIVEVFVLDCRGERKPSKGEYISTEQKNWLLNGLKYSECKWKVVFNSVPITDLPDFGDGNLSLTSDRWEGYRDLRSNLINSITNNNVEGVLFVSGDMHNGSVNRVNSSGPASMIFEIITGPAGSSPINPHEENVTQYLYTNKLKSATHFTLDSEGFGEFAFLSTSGEILFKSSIDTKGNISEIERL